MCDRENSRRITPHATTEKGRRWESSFSPMSGNLHSNSVTRWTSQSNSRPSFDSTRRRIERTVCYGRRHLRSHARSSTPTLYIGICAAPSVPRSGCAKWRSWARRVRRGVFPIRVMFFGDLITAFVNIRIALKARGRLGFVCWCPLDENIWMQARIDAARPLLPATPPPDP